MDVLFETHCEEELEDLPPAAILIGINCRNFNTRPSGFKMARLLRQWWLWSQTDKTVNLDRFNYASQLPAHAIKVAESGVTSQNCSDVFALGFHAALVGTSLLMDPRGIAVALDEFRPQVLTSFVRNALIDEVLLPRIGDNLAKQIGALDAPGGDSRRTFFHALHRFSDA